MLYRSKQEKLTGKIHLSDKHLEFINRQARTPFEINPFTYQLLKRLFDEKKTLGKFKVHRIDEPLKVSTLLGLAAMGNTPEQYQAMRAHPGYKDAMRKVSIDHDKRITKQQENHLSKIIIDKAKKVKDDEYNYYPIDYDFRGRVYTRVPFISYQSADSGRYLNRFKEKTPIDSRTKFWLQIGMANAAGVDKVSWDERVTYCENNEKDIINVGKMLDDGDFDRAYAFLEKVEEPFAFAALANEYVKVFVDKSQDYTQVYVYVDCSCSGTSIFNAWRRSLYGAKFTNLIETPEPQDIYMEVWREMKRLSPDGLFPSYRIKKLEKSKYLRKMMKNGYVPAQYASAPKEQHRKLKEFNKTYLKPNKIGFKDEEMVEFCKLWDKALNKVSSIQTVVTWFQSRVKEIAKSGRNEITYTTPNGSVMTLRYPKTRFKKVRTFSLWLC